MSKHRESIINLQITVPHIVLPAGDQPSSREQVSVAPIEQPSHEYAGKPISTMKEGRFNLFLIENLSAHSGAWLLRILRPSFSRKEQRPGAANAQPVHLQPTDTLAFRVEFRQNDGPPDTAQGDHLHPLSTENIILIVLDDQSIPINYSIDGARS